MSCLSVNDDVQSWLGNVILDVFYYTAPEAPPSDLKATDIAMYTIDVEWSPPPSDFVPGIIREYNLTYRNLNYTHEMLTKEHFESSVTSYRMENLIGLTLYEINVTSTTILPGPWATLYVLTLEGGSLFFLSLIKLILKLPLELN